MKKAGTLSCSFMLIVIGILSILTQLNKLTITTQQSFIIVAAFFIILGIELIFTKNKNSYINFPLIIFTSVILVVACGLNYNIRYDIGEMSNISRNQMNIKKSFNQIIDADNIKTLNLDNSYGNINIIKSQTTYIQIKSKIYSNKNFLSKDIVYIKRNESNLSITSEKRKNTSVDYDIYLPDNIDVTVDNAFGDVTISDVQTKNINVHDSFGNINAYNVISNINITDNHGDVTLNSVKCNTQINNSFGSITVNYEMPDYNTLDNIVLSNDFGDINVTGLNYDNCYIKADTSFGDVKFSNLLRNNTVNDFGKHINYQNGNGKLHITVTDKFGDISLY